MAEELGGTSPGHATGTGDTVSLPNVSAHSIEVLEAPPPDAVELQALLDAAHRSDDHQPLGEQKRLALRGKGPFLALLLRGPTPDGPDTLVGLALLAPASDGFGLEVVVHPAHRATHLLGGDDPRRLLVAGARREVQRRGGGILRYWVAQATPEDDAAARSLGFDPERELLQLRVDLPIAATDELGALPVRAFVPGIDEAAWLAVNARAFADHPEQGAWDEATLAARESEAWFDPTGFLIAEEDGRIIGSCWTKVHRDGASVVGEIYVISVDPRSQRRGLGRGLTVAGLDWLARAGAQSGMLYVDAANGAAVALYRSLGFRVDHADRSYVARLEPR